MYIFDLHLTLVVHSRKWILEEEITQFITLYIMSRQKGLLRKTLYKDIFEITVEISLADVLTLRNKILKPNYDMH